MNTYRSKSGRLWQMFGATHPSAYRGYGIIKLTSATENVAIHTRIEPDEAMALIRMLEPLAALNPDE